MRILKTRSFRWWEMGLIKLCLISLGIILGLYFRVELLDYLWLWWTIFVLTAIFFLFRERRER